MCIYRAIHFWNIYFCSIIRRFCIGFCRSVGGFSFEILTTCDQWSSLYWWILLITTNCQYSIVGKKNRWHNFMTEVSIPHEKQSTWKTPWRWKEISYFIFQDFATNNNKIERYLCVYWTYLMAFPLLEIVFEPRNYNISPIFTKCSPYDGNNPQSTTIHNCNCTENEKLRHIHICSYRAVPSDIWFPCTKYAMANSVNS